MDVETVPSSSLKLSAILSGLSYALDLTEGHPRGHASRSCLIGMRIGRALGLSPEDQSDLFYALLLKDAGFVAIWGDLTFLSVFTVLMTMGATALFKRTL